MKAEGLSASDHPGRLFGQLKVACAEEWARYVHHPFVRALGEGTLPLAAFRHYLEQDYLFLVQFARAWALAVVKSDSLAEMRQAARGLHAILDQELSLHVSFAAGWGVSEAELAAAAEAPATLAYTRYVLATGFSGDLLDLEVALVPCIIGYAEIGAALARTASLEGHPYRAWIETYAGPDYQEVARAAAVELDRLWESRAGGGRFERLAAIFREATRLEADFWQMGLDHVG